MKGRVVLTLAVLVLSVAYGGPAFGQATGGAITGQVLDPNGAVITNATVSIKNEATGQSLNTQTTGSGSFSFPNVLGAEPPAPQPPYFWSDQFGLRLQLVGDPRGAFHVELEGGDDDFVALYRDRDGTLLAGLAANRPREVDPLRRELALAA